MSNLQRILNMAAKALDKKGQTPGNGSGKTDWRDMVRTAADKVTGDSRPSSTPPAYQARPGVTPPRPAASRPAARPAVNPEDAAAIARYDYLLKTAQPEQLEQVHRDAFARLSPAQREQVSSQLREGLPATEQPASNEPADLARAAARGEAHNPGFLRKLFSQGSGRAGSGALAGAGVGAVAGVGLGAAGGLLAAVAGGAVLSNVAAPLLDAATGMGVDFENLAGDLGGLGETAVGDLSGLGETAIGDVTAGAEEYTSGLGEQVSELGSNFEIPGLGNLGDFFGRGN